MINCRPAFFSFLYLCYKPNILPHFRILFSIQKLMKSPINYKPNQPGFIQNMYVSNYNTVSHHQRIAFGDSKLSRNGSPKKVQLSPDRRTKIKLVSPMKFGRSVISPKMKENVTNLSSFDLGLRGRETLVNNTKRAHLKTRSQLQPSYCNQNSQKQSIRNTQWIAYEDGRYAHKHPSQKYSPFVIVSENPSPSHSPTKVVINHKPLYIGSLESQIIYVAPFQHIKRQKISAIPKSIQKYEPIQESIYILKQKQLTFRQNPKQNNPIIQNLRQISDIRKDIEADNIRFKQILSSSRASRRTTQSRLEEDQVYQQELKIAKIYQQQNDNVVDYAKPSDDIDSKTTLIYELRGLTNTKLSLKNHQSRKFDISVQTQQTNSLIQEVQPAASPFQKKDKLFLMKNLDVQLQLCNTPKEIKQFLDQPFQSISQKDSIISQVGLQVKDYVKNVLEKQETIAIVQLEESTPLQCSPMKYSQSFIKNQYDRNHEQKYTSEKKQVQLERSIIREHQSLLKIQETLKNENKYQNLIQKQQKLQEMPSSISLKLQEQKVTKTVPQLEIISSIKQIKRADDITSQRIVRADLQAKLNKDASKRLKNRLYL